MINKKNILVAFIVIIIIVLSSLLIYSNLFVKNEENEEKPVSSVDENKLVKEHYSDDLMISNMKIVSDDNSYTIMFDFKSNNDYNVLDLGIWLKDKEDKTLFVVPIHINDVIANENRKIEFSWENIDVSSSYDYVFSKTEPEGVG